MLSDQLKSAIDGVKKLILSGNLDYAQFECTRIVAEHNSKVMPYCMMSYILHLQADFNGSTRYALKAMDVLQIEKLWQDVLSVSNACLMVGEEELAVSIMSLLKNIENIEPKYIQDIAKQYGKIDELATAAELFSIIPESEMSFHSWQMYGVSLVYLGRPELAVSMFKKAIEINPLDCVSYNEISSLNVVESREQRVVNLESIVSSSNIDSLNLAYANYALFNEYDSSNNTKKAFDCLLTANYVRRQSVNYDPVLERKNYENIILQFKSIEIEVGSYNAVNSTQKTPVFIVGMPRTGTTLLEKILNRYSNVYSCGELRTMRTQLQSAARIHLNDPGFIGRSDQLKDLDYNLIGSEYMRNVIWRVGDAQFFTDKHPSNNVFVGMIAKSLPNAKIIHITKNPLDACFSNFKKLFSLETYTYSYSIDELIAYYRNYDYLMKFWEEKLPNHVLHINYESLVLDTERQAERIRQFCGFPEEIKENQNFVTNTLSAVQVRKPIHAGNINAWAKYAEQLKPLREALDEEYVAYMRQIEGVQIL